MLALMKGRWFLIIDYYNETKLLGVWNLGCVCCLQMCAFVCGRQVEKDNMGYEEVHVISSSLIPQHNVSVQQTCLTIEEEAPRGNGFSDSL